MLAVKASASANPTKQANRRPPQGRGARCCCHHTAANTASGGITGKAYPMSLELGIEKKPKMANIQIQHSATQWVGARTSEAAGDAATVWRKPRCCTAVRTRCQPSAKAKNTQGNSSTTTATP